ncbi:MAG: hypothetical protein RLO08_11645 [Parvibaculaceae bacterium]
MRDLDSCAAVRHCPAVAGNRGALCDDDNSDQVDIQMTAVYAIAAFIIVMALLNKMTFGRFD